MVENEWIRLIAIFIVFIAASIAYDILRTRSIVNSKMPQAVFDFPVFESTEEEYNALKQEIKQLILDVLENRRSELILTTEQLNCISTRGITPIKGKNIVFPTYYETDDNKLIESGLSYPCTDTMSGYLITVRATEFTGTMCSSELISVNGSPPSSDRSGTRFFPLHDLTLFIFLCDYDRKKMIELAKKITIVEIIDDKLVMRV